ncbi:hypothetical protein BG000_005030 [Podila horticola]|nr:hypothetical protein BG000_005030 [Podila horticola]
MKFITFSAIVVAIVALAATAEAATPCYTRCMKEANDYNYCRRSCYDSTWLLNFAGLFNYRDCQKMGESSSDCMDWCRN